jgi:pantoate--beta-alanine ligase
MDIIRGKAALHAAIEALKRSRKRIALVPTMGALHAGHASLVTRAQSLSDAVAVSIFVNPTQFGPNEDFARYPRDEAADLALLEKLGTDIAYLPSAEEMYGPHSITRILLPGISEELCGAFRPGHFSGVATVVLKLLMQAMPDLALFGEKDYQQLHILRSMARDLDVPAQIQGAPTLREADGLALSSRNRYLNASQRTQAGALYRTLDATAARLRAGLPVKTALAQAEAMLAEAGFGRVDYVSLRRADDLGVTERLEEGVPCRLLAAAFLGTTRLIDNIAV